MKNLLRYILVILMLFGIGNYNYSQCNPEFFINSDAADLGSNRYLLTEDKSTSHPDGSQDGQIWNKAFLNLNNDFEIVVKLNFGSNSGTGQGSGNHGSDGIAFVLQTDPNGTSAGSVGGGLGYAGVTQGIRPSVAVEFDTHLNITNAPCEGGDCPLTFFNGDVKDHMAIQKNGFSSHNLQNGQVDMLWPSGNNGPHVLGNIETGLDFDVKFVWTAATNTFQVFFDDLTASAVATLTYDFVNDADIFNGNPIVYWGFTAATGGYSNRHEVEIITANVPLSISYPNSLYCSSNVYSSSQQAVSISGQRNGIFSSSPNGLSINSTTGQIDASLSQPGTYTITYSVDNSIPSSDPNYIYCGATTTTIQIDEDPDFTYSKSSYCQSENDFLPNFIANSGGTFSVTPANGLSINSGTGEINPTASTPGTYSLTYTTPTCSITTNHPVTVEILASPTVDAGSDFSVCSGDQVTLTSTGNASTYDWYTDVSLIYPVSSNPFNTSNYASGTYPYTFYVQGTGSNGCTAIDDVVVSLVNPSFVDAGTYNNICIGTPVSLNGTGTGTFTWSSSGDGNFDDNTSLTAVYTPGTNDNTNGNVTLTLDVDQGSPCGVISDNTTINFTTTFANNSVAINPTNPTPNDDLTADINTTPCVDVSTNDWRLDGNSIAPLNFSFNTSGTAGLTSKSTNPAVLSIDGTPPTISEGISGNCLDFSFAGQLDANVSTISPSDGISISLWTYSRDIITTGFRRWVQLFSTNPTDGTLEQELLIRQSNGNIIEAVVWSGIGPGSNNNPEWQEDFIYESNQIEQNVWQHWVLTFNNDQTMILYKDGGVDPLNDVFSTTAFRTGGLDDITAIRINANSTNFYDGFIDEVMVFDRVLTSQQVEALYNSGNPDYEKIVKEETNCGETWTLNSIPYNHIGEEGTATLSSSVSIPLVSLSTQPSSGADVCQGTTASTMTVVASSGSGNYTYQWYTCQSDGSNPLIISGETNASFSPPTSSPGTTYYIVTVTDQDANCGSETSNVVSQKVDESITIDAGGDQTVCGNDVVNITGTITGGVSTGTWSASAAGSFGNTTDLSTTFTPGASLLGGGTVDITLTSAANGACPAVTDQLTLTINSADAGFSYAYSEYCSDETNPIPTITGEVGTFSTSSGLLFADVSSNAGSVTGIIDLAGSTAGTYTITYTLTGACPNSSTFDVTITTPTVGFNYGGQTSFCLGTTPPSITYTAPTGGVFSSNNSNLIVNPSTGEIDLVNSLPGNYEITYDYSSINQLGNDITSNQLNLISFTNGVSMNTTGNRIAVGYPLSNLGGVDYNGGVKVFERNGSSWTQMAGWIQSGYNGGRTGTCVSLNADGTVLAVITPRLFGRLDVFEWNGTSWIKIGNHIDLSAMSNNNWTKEDNFKLDINNDGSIVAVSLFKRYNSTNIEGKVSIYEWSGTAWNQKGATLSGDVMGDQLGNSISLNSTGDRIAIGAFKNDANNGEVKIFDWDGSSWNSIKEFNGTTGEQLGFAVSLNDAGDRIAISENNYNSNTGRINVYENSGGTWNALGSQIEGASTSDQFGQEVKLNALGDHLVSSSISGNGYAKLYQLSGSTWVNKGTVNGDNSGDQFGRAIQISANGDRFIVGSPYFDNSGVSNTGKAQVFQTSKTCPEPLSVTITELPVTAGTDFTICEGENYTLSASGGVTYSWSPTTGLDDPTSATPIATPPAGTYTYTVTGSDATGCSGTAQQVLTVLPNDVSTFSYSSCCYPSDATDPQPTFSGTTGGNYTSSTGLSISSTTGEIDLDASVPGAYTVTYATSSSNACPASSSQNILVMNSNNCNTVDFNVTGSAIDNGNNNYQVTPNQNSQVGAVWSQSPLNLNYPFHISAELNFGIKNTDGADGIVFVLQESSNTLTHNGGGIGYAVGSSNQNPGFNPSLGIEFDTHFNPTTDPPATNSTSNDHLAIQLNGDIDHSNSLINPVDLLDIEDGNNHPLTIFWDPNPDNDLSTVEGELKVYFDNQLVATLSRDLLSDFTSSNNGMVYWGFTGSTGGYNNTQVVNYLNSSFWSGRNPTTLSDNINEWQGDVSSPTESITDPIDNSIQYTTASWFNPCNWSASFVPDYDTDVVIPQQSDYVDNGVYRHPIVNYNDLIFTNHSVLNLDMDRDGDVGPSDRVQGKAFAKSLQLEGDALFFIKSDDGDPSTLDAEIQVKD